MAESSRRSDRRRVRGLVLVLAGALLAPSVHAQEPPTPPAMEGGRWRGTSANAKGLSYEFMGNLKAVMYRASGESEIVYRLYRKPQTPWPVDLFGFPPGPLQSKVLYCIVAVDEDRMRLA